MRLLGEKGIARVFSLALIAFSLIVRAGYSLTPEELALPTISSPLYKGAEVVEVGNFTPNATVTIYANGTNKIGEGTCWFSKCPFTVNPLVKDQKITATQTVDGVTSYPTRDEDGVTVQEIPDEYLDPNYNKERLLAPLIDSPLVECQRIVPVKNVIEGALVQVFLSPHIDKPIGRDKMPWNYARLGTPELTKGQKIAANQQLFFPKASDLSPEKPVEAKPKPEDFPKPDVNEKSLVVGNDTVEVRNLWIGAKVDIYYQQGQERESIGGGFTPWPNALFPVRPLKATWIGCLECIKADQSLCPDLTATSTGKSVKNSIERPVIREPICAGSFRVPVCNTVPKSGLKVFIEGNPDTQVAMQGAVSNCTDVTVGGPNGNLTFKVPNQIYVTQEVASLKSQSALVDVRDKSDPVFEIGNGNPCPPCSGQDDGPIFVRDSLTNKSGPVFRAKMCGAEAARVEIRNPDGALIDTITLEEIKGKKGHFEGTWDWNKMGWNTSKDIPFGKYKSTFTIWPVGPGSKQDKYFYVKTQGCVNCAVIEFHQACVDRHNKLRALENPPLPPLQRDQGHEGNADDDAKVNYEAGIPHKQMSGNAQNECSLYSSIEGILDDCIERSMYYGEIPCYTRHEQGDPKACFSNGNNPGCDCQYGHYENMTKSGYSKLACGIYMTPDGRFKAVMDFFQ